MQSSNHKHMHSSTALVFFEKFRVNMISLTQ